MASLMDDDFVDKCINEYKNGKSIRCICRETGIGNSGGRRLLRDIMLYNGITINGSSTCSHLGSKSVAEYIGMYKQGMSLSEIKELCGIERHLLSYILRRENVPIRINGRKYKDNGNLFSTISNESSAYWLGFLYADGNVCSKNSRYILDVSLAYKDYDHLCKLRSWIAPDRVVSTRIIRCNGKEYRACRLAVSSKILIKNLIRLGCIPDKSLILTFPNSDQVPDDLIHHFMRGYFDGDGSISNCQNPHMNIDSTLTFLTSYFNVLSRYGVTVTNITKPSGCYSISKGGRNQLRIIHKFLYNNSHIHLERKKIIFDQIVNYCPHTK